MTPSGTDLVHRHVGRRTIATLIVGVFVLIAVIGSARPGSASAAVTRDDRPDRVVVVSIPGLGWADLETGGVPAFTRLVEHGAVGALSVKTIGRRTTAAAAYATIGAGARATAPDGASSSGWGIDERLPSGRTARREALAQGRRAHSASVVIANPAAVAEANAGQHQGAEPGSLGTSITRHGWSTAVVANNDGPEGIDRTAALAVADRSGLIRYGTVAPSLGATDAVADAVRALPQRGVVALVELPEVAASRSVDADAVSRRNAVHRADVALAAVLAELGPRDLVIAMSPTAPGPRDEPTPIAMSGPGVDVGLLRSATTRKAGHVTLPDLAPTILDRIGAPIPAAISGTPSTVEPSSAPGDDRLGDLQGAVAETRFVDRSGGIMLSTLPIVFACWTILVLVAVLAPSGRRTDALRWFVRWIGLGIALAPTLTYVISAATTRSWGQPRWSMVVWGIAALGAAAASTLRPDTRAPLLAAAFVWAVPVLDLLAGGRLQFGSPLGNSPTVAGRFAGIGNNSFGLLTASSILFAVGLWQAVERRRPGWPALSAAGAVFGVALVVDGAPGLGSDVGGVLALGPVAAITLWSLAGRALSWGRVALAGLATVAVLGLLIAADLARPEASQTHLGRLARRVGGGDGDRDVLIRKADAAVSSITGSSLVWIVVCTFLLAALLWGLARRPMQELLGRPLARSLVIPAVSAGVLGGALNDSGVMVPAMMATVFVPAAIHLLLDPDGPLARPAGGRTDVSVGSSRADAEPVPIAPAGEDLP